MDGGDRKISGEGRSLLLRVLKVNILIFLYILKSRLVLGLKLGFMFHSSIA